jgi:hypothetical protein
MSGTTAARSAAVTERHAVKVHTRPASGPRFTHQARDECQRQKTNRHIHQETGSPVEAEQVEAEEQTSGKLTKDCRRFPARIGRRESAGRLD